MSISNQPEMRVLQLISTPLKLNGQTLFPLRMAKSMTRVQSDFLSYALADERVRAEVESMGGEVFIAPHRLKHPLKYIRYVSKQVRERGYKIVHCHGNSCTLAIDLLAAKLGGAKVRIAHSHNSCCKFMLLHRVLRLPFNRLYTHAFACGEEAGRWLFHQKPFTVVRNAIDACQFAYCANVRKSMRAELGLADDEIALGCVANLLPQKNHAFLLDMYAKLIRSDPRCRLILVGDGALRETLEQQARDLGIADRVFFLGLRTDVPQLLQAMDVMLLPSLYEGFPTVALEWQAAGLPTLMSDGVTRACAFVDSVRFFPLDADEWIRAIQSTPLADRAAASREGVRAITEAGFDLTAAAAALQDDYRRFTE